MVRHQAGQTAVSALVAEEPGAVQGMKAGNRQTWRVPDVVQPGRRHQQFTEHTRQSGQPLGLGCYRLDMTPPARQGISQLPHGKIPRRVPTDHDRDGTCYGIPFRITPLLRCDADCGWSGVSRWVITEAPVTT